MAVTARSPVAARALMALLPVVAIAFWPVPASLLIPFPKLALVLLFGACAIIASGDALFPAEGDRWSNVILGAYAAFAAAVLLRAVGSPFIGLGLWGIATRMNGALMYVGLAIALWTARQAGASPEPERLARGMVLAGLLTSTYGVLQWMGMDVIGWAIGGILSSLGNPDHTSSFHAIMVVAATWVALDKAQPRSWRILGVVVAVMSAGVTLFWFPRGVVQGVLLIAIACGATGAAEAWRRGRRSLVLAIAIAVAMAAIPLAWSAVTTDRGTMDRVYLVRVGLRIWTHSPIYGVGVARLQAVFNLFRELADVREFGLDRNVDDVHSLPFQLLATTGLWGFIPFVLFLVAAAGYAIRAFFRTATPRTSLARLYALVFLLWVIQCLYSPDSSPISLVGIVALGGLLGMSAAPRAADALAPASTGADRGRWRIARIAAGVALIVLTLHRTVLEVMLLEVDSRTARQKPPTFFVRAQAANAEIADNLSRVIRLYPNDPTFLTKYGEKLGAAGYFKVAETVFLRAVAADSLDYIATDDLAKQYRAEGRIAEGYVMAKRVCTLLPRDPRAWYRRSLMAIMAGDSADARIALATARQRAHEAGFGDIRFWRSMRTTQRRLGPLPTVPPYDPPDKTR